MKDSERIKNILKETLKIEIKNVYDLENRALFFGTDFLCDIEVEDNNKTLSLSGISIPKYLRGKGLSKKIVKNLEEFSKYNEYTKFKVPAVISSKMDKTLKNLGYLHEEFKYSNFDPSLYDGFDGFYGTYYKIL